MSTTTVHHKWRGSFTSQHGHPSKDGTHIAVADQARHQIVDKLVARPGSAYVEYNTIQRQVSDHGRMYTYNGGEEVMFSDEQSNSHGGWTGTVTVDIKAPFAIQQI